VDLDDAFISGGVDVACGGPGPACIVWDRSRGSRDIRGAAALSSMPCLLVIRNPAVKSVRDFTDRDRIAMAGAGASVHTIYLQMAVAREFGLGRAARSSSRPSTSRRFRSLTSASLHPAPPHS
jgi:NitT/TauT family transport system substrate-binding protein